MTSHRSRPRLRRAVSALTLACALLSAAAGPSAAESPSSATENDQVATAAVPDMIGGASHYRTRYEDTLLEVARRFGLGYVEMMAANPTLDPWLPGDGAQVSLPTRHLLPDAPRKGIVVNLGDMRLYHFRDDETVRSYPIGIGREGAHTPLGATTITLKREAPTWIPPASIREEKPDLPAAIGPGPDNPLGDYALNLGWRNYVIHGTNRPYGIGRRVSHGCIRLYPEDILALFESVEVGTPVTVVDQPVKLGWWKNALYLEVHPSRAIADLIEQGLEVPPAELDDALAERIRAAAGDFADQIDWDAVRNAVARRHGAPVAITPQLPTAELPEAGSETAAGPNDQAENTDR